MKFAVIQAAGKQYQVSEGETLEINKLEGKPKKKIVFDKVLLVVDGDKISLGQPLVKGATVTAEIIEQKKGDKIRVAKFKAKSRYRKVQGHRQLLTQIKIKKIAFVAKKT